MDFFKKWFHQMVLSKTFFLTLCKTICILVIAFFMYSSFTLLIEKADSFELKLGETQLNYISK